MPGRGFVPPFIDDLRSFFWPWAPSRCSARPPLNQRVSLELVPSVIVIWCMTGPIFGFSDTWQLIINTGTTIATFLMVFVIQNSQNRDNGALQVKLDELIRVSEVK